MVNLAIDGKAFVQDFKSVQATSSQGAAFVTESLKKLSNTELTHNVVGFVLEAASKINDSGINSWVSKWNSSTKTTQFGLGLVTESLGLHPSTVSNQTLLARIGELTSLPETEAIEKIASTGVLSKWMLNPKVYAIVKQAKESYYSPEQKEMTAAKAEHPIGLSIDKSETDVLSVFDGIQLVYKKDSDSLIVDASGDANLTLVASVINMTSDNYSHDRNCYAFMTPVGEITIGDAGLKLGSDVVSFDAIMSIVAEYYKLNQFNRGKQADIKILDRILKVVPVLVANYSQISMFSNIFRTLKTNSMNEYFVQLVNSSVVVRKVTEPSGSFRVSINSFDDIATALSTLTDKQIATELTQIYAVEIEQYASKNAAETAERKALNGTLTAIDNAIVLAETALADIDDSFVSRDKIDAINSKLEALRTKRSETLESIANVGKIADLFDTAATAVVTAELAVNESKNFKTIGDAVDAAIKKGAKIKKGKLDHDNEVVITSGGGPYHFEITLFNPGSTDNLVTIDDTQGDDDSRNVDANELYELLTESLVNEAYSSLKPGDEGFLDIDRLNIAIAGGLWKPKTPKAIKAYAAYGAHFNVGDKLTGIGTKRSKDTILHIDKKTGYVMLDSGFITHVDASNEGKAFGIAGGFDWKSINESVADQVIPEEVNEAFTDISDLKRIVCVNENGDTDDDYDDNQWNDSIEKIQKLLDTKKLGTISENDLSNAQWNLVKKMFIATEDVNLGFEHLSQRVGTYKGKPAVLILDQWNPGLLFVAK